MTNAGLADLHRFFSDKGKHLQSAVNGEIRRIGGERMLFQNEDLNRWVHTARDQLKTCWTVCRMLEEKAMGIDTKAIQNQMQENIPEHRAELDSFRRKEEEEQRALKDLREEAEYYRQALEVLDSRK